MANDLAPNLPPSFSRVLEDAGTLTIDELQGMLAQDIDTTKAIALRMNGVAHELLRAEALVDADVIDHSQPAGAVHELAERAGSAASELSTVVETLRDLLEAVSDHADDDAADLADDEEE